MAGWWRGEKVLVKEGDTLRSPFRGYIKGTACLYKMVYKGGYFYIGSTKCIEARITGHRNTHHYGDKKWEHLKSIQILAVSNDINKLRQLEKQTIKEIFAKIKCLNIIRK